MKYSIIKFKNFRLYRRIRKKKKTDKKEENKRKEKAQIEIAEAWDTIPFAQIIRGLMLITQSTLRKYILLLSLIIAKNITRILLLQFPEWSEDLKEWNREIHIKCTYNGVQLSEREFPQNWLLDGIQIKILFPFCLKPWYGSKIKYSYLDRAAEYLFQKGLFGIIVPRNLLKSVLSELFQLHAFFPSNKNSKTIQFY